MYARRDIRVQRCIRRAHMHAVHYHIMRPYTHTPQQEHMIRRRVALYVEQRTHTHGARGTLSLDVCERARIKAHICSASESDIRRGGLSADASRTMTGLYDVRAPLPTRTCNAHIYPLVKSTDEQKSQFMLSQFIYRNRKRRKQEL